MMADTKKQPHSISLNINFKLSNNNNNSNNRNNDNNNNKMNNTAIRRSKSRSKISSLHSGIVRNVRQSPLIDIFKDKDDEDKNKSINSNSNNNNTIFMQKSFTQYLPSMAKTFQIDKLKQKLCNKNNTINK